MRSLTEPPGFASSALPSTAARGCSRASRRISIKGVSPIRSSTLAYTRFFFDSVMLVGNAPSDHIHLALGPGAPQAELFGTRADVRHRNLVEAGFDTGRQVAKHR